MSAQRQQVASRLRAEGEEQAQTIRSEADRERTVILAEAERDAQKLRGEGDAPATRIYGEAANRDAGFYAFPRSLEAYRAAFEDGDSGDRKSVVWGKSVAVRVDLGGPRSS